MFKIVVVLNVSSHKSSWPVRHSNDKFPQNRVSSRGKVYQATIETFLVQSSISSNIMKHE